MMTIDKIARQIAEEEDNLIAKAFTMQIATLLRQNGIIPIVTRTEATPEIVSGKNNYILTKKFGVSFHELDCTEHDKEIYNKVIDDFAKWLVEHKIVDEDSMQEIIIDFNEEQLKADESE